MKDPKRKPAACEECEKENCMYYIIDELTGNEICWENTEDEVQGTSHRESTQDM